MLIKNKATGREYNVSIENWNKLKEMNRSSLFTVISKEDIVKNPSRINIPKQIHEFQSSLKIETKKTETKPNKTTKK